jgi:hypothetical protein
MLAYIIDANTGSIERAELSQSGFKLRDAKADVQLEVVPVIGHAQQACHALF